MPEANEDKARRQTPPAPDEPSEAAGEGLLPPPDSIISEEVFTSPAGRQYRIIHSDETDADERPKPHGRKSSHADATDSKSAAEPTKPAKAGSAG